MKYTLTLLVLLATGCQCTDCWWGPSNEDNRGPADFLTPPSGEQHDLLYHQRNVACAGCRGKHVPIWISPLETKLPDNWYEHNIG